MYLLKDLWYGNVTPGERFGRRGSEYMKLTEEATEMMDRLIAELSPEGAKLLEELLDKQIVLHSIAEEDTFVRGVRIGAQFILDVVGDYKSQLPQLGDK